MSVKVFQIFHDKANDDSSTKGNFTKVYHQQGAQIKEPDKNIEFFFERIITII